MMSPLQRPLLLLLAMCLVAQAGANLIEYSHEVAEGSRFGGDFIGFWDAAHRVRHGDIAGIYDPDAWRKFLSANTPSVLSLFVYPPFTLLILWPLGDATYNEAVLAWSVIPLVFYFALVFLLAKRSGLGTDADPTGVRRWPRTPAYIVLIAFSLPFLIANLLSGQTGALIAVFFLGAAFFWPTRPVLAGICIGLLAIKPQMGLLIPFALIASGQWRIFASAAATVLMLIVVSTIWLGAAIWPDYVRKNQLFGELLVRGYDHIWQLALSPYVSLQGAGMPTAVAVLLQGLISVTVLIVIVRIFWRRKSNRHALGKKELVKGDARLDLRLALLAAGTLLTTPYALSYDTPLLILSILPVLTRSWHEGWDGIELVSVTALLALPYAQTLVVGSHVPFAFLALLLWFGALYRRFQNERPRPSKG